MSESLITEVLQLSQAAWVSFQEMGAKTDYWLMSEEKQPPHRSLARELPNHCRFLKHMIFFSPPNCLPNFLVYVTIDISFYPLCTWGGKERWVIRNIWQREARGYVWSTEWVIYKEVIKSYLHIEASRFTKIFTCCICMRFSTFQMGKCSVTVFPGRWEHQSLAFEFLFWNYKLSCG